MLKNKGYTNKSIFLLFLFAIGLIYGCANMRAPEGGPRDKTPPKAINMTPKNLTTNFKADKITIEFDEYFNLQGEFKEFSISPEQEKTPVLKKRQRKLEISFIDSLEKNTTYTLNFGNAIVDANEGNILKNFTYVFSTGPKLDSLSIHGKVINTVTGKPEFDATVFILPLSRDTLFGKRKPSIFTSTDSSGNFRLNNLRKDTYKIYALKETAGDKIYQQLTDQVGFLKDPIVLTKNIDTIQLGLFKELATNFRLLDRKLNPDGSLFLSFNQQLVKPELVIIEPKDFSTDKLVRFTKNNDSVKVWLKEMTFDSLKIAIKSDGKALDTVSFSREKKDTYVRANQITDNLILSSQLNPYKPYRLFTNFPVAKIDPSKIKFLEDSIPRTTFTLERDSTDILAATLKYAWNNRVTYNITYGEGTFIDFFGNKSKEFKRTFKLASADDYSTLTLTVEVPEAGNNYVIELLNDKKEVVARQSITKNTKINYINYKTGTYSARAIYDSNKNDKWDTGSLKDQTQPEKIWYIQKELIFRSNFEVRETMSIPKEQ